MSERKTFPGLRISFTVNIYPAVDTAQRRLWKSHHFSLQYNVGVESEQTSYWVDIDRDDALPGADEYVTEVEYLNLNIADMVCASIGSGMQEADFFAQEKSGMGDLFGFNLQRSLKELSRTELSLRKKRLGLKRGGSKIDYNLASIGSHYEKLLPVWKDAKSIWKKNRERRNWQVFIQSEYRNLDLPVDLVARLSDNPSDLLDHIKVRLSEKGGSASPSDIALEHASRLCGVPEYHYTLRHLRDALAKKNGSKSRVLPFTKKAGKQ